MGKKYFIILQSGLCFCYQGGALASIEDPEEQNFIKGNVEVFQGSHSSFWIGLYKTHKGMSIIVTFKPVLFPLQTLCE